MKGKANMVDVPSDGDVNWMSPVQGESPLVQVKEPYGNFDMVILVGFHPATRSVLSTPADNSRKRVWRYIEKERRMQRLNVGYLTIYCCVYSMRWFF